MVLASTIDAIVWQAIERQIFPGAVVLIARDDHVLYQAAHGTTMYHHPGSRPVDHDTIYDIASLTKVFTATAALRLVEQGLLDIAAPAADYLPELRTRDVAVLHLLTHTSGFDLRLSTLCAQGADGLRAAVYSTIPLYSPGTTVAYTNINSLLLGEIVSRVCGKSLSEALQTLVIAPLGLQETLFHPPVTLLSRIAPTEIDDSWRGGLVHGVVHDESAFALGGVAGHAGLFSTVCDLYCFCRVWLNRGAFPDRGEGICLLSSSTVRLACMNHTAGLGPACGLGWMIDRPNFMGAAPSGTFGHTGFTGPAIVIAPQHRLIVIVLSNRTYPRRKLPEHHAVTAAIVESALQF